MSYRTKGHAATRRRATARRRTTRRRAPAAPRPRRARARRPKRAKLTKRYNPITGERVMLPPGDTRIDDWPSRKPSAASRRRNRLEQATVTERVALGAATALAGTPAAAARTARVAGRTAKAVNAAVRAAGGYRAVASATGALTMGEIAAGGAAAVAGTAALALAVGLGSYYATTWLIEHFRPRTRDEKRYAAAMAYKEARKALSVRLHRSITPEENRALGDEFKRKLAEIDHEYASLT